MNPFFKCVCSQLHCPQSCERALLWNPWARQKLQIPVDYNHRIHDNCTVPQNSISAAQILLDRLLTLMSGEYPSGFSFSAPTEFFGMVGLAEVILYADRLSGFSLGMFTKSDLEREVCNALAQFNGDLIMRSLPRWTSILNDTVSNAVAELIPNRQKDVCFSGFSDFENLAPKLSEYHRHKFPTLEQSIASDALPLQLPLSNGMLLPAIGLGTWQLNGGECIAAVKTAINLGYRHIDSAQAYGNEREIGIAVEDAIKDGVLSRNELFLATKLSFDSSAGYEAAKTLVREQLQALRTNYIDLYMLHSPLADGGLQRETWRAMEDLVDEGVIKALGLSNFDSRNIKDLMEYARIKPVVLQNKFDIYHIAKQIDDRGDDVLATCEEFGIRLVAYSPLSAYPFAMLPSEDPIVRYIALRHQASPTAVVLSWILSKGAAVIPRSSTETHLADNLNAMKIRLTNWELSLLNSLANLVSSPISVVPQSV